ncbi:MAG: hypothetical protein SGI74_06670 [Oligoflexia bacterium]|nr:hypothetical protein [Oligoflexia bacterium]
MNRFLFSLLALLFIPNGVFASDILIDPDEFYERVRIAVSKVSQKISHDNNNPSLRIELSKVGYQALDSLGVMGAERFLNTSLILDVYNSRLGDKIDLTSFELAIYEVISPDVENGFGARFLTFQHDVLQPGVSSNYYEVVSGSFRLKLESAASNFQIKFVARVGLGSWSGLQQRDIDKNTHISQEIHKTNPNCKSCELEKNESLFSVDTSKSIMAEVNLYRAVSFLASSRSVGRKREVSHSDNGYFQLYENYFQKEMKVEADMGKIIWPMTNNQFYFYGAISKITGDMTYSQLERIPVGVQPNNKRYTYGVRWIVPRFW